MDAVYKKIEVVGTSTESVSSAIQNAIRKAAKTVKNLSWFEVTEMRGRIENGDIQQYQVTVKIGFKVEE